MIRNLVFAGFVAVVTFAIATAEEFTAAISKVEGGKVTFARLKKGDGDKKGFVKGDDETLPAATGVKILTGKFNKEEMKIEAGEALEGGFSNDRFKTIDEKRGVRATITTDDSGKAIKQIIVMPNFGGKKKKDV